MVNAISWMARNPAKTGDRVLLVSSACPPGCLFGQWNGPNFRVVTTKKCCFDVPPSFGAIFCHSPSLSAGQVNQQSFQFADKLKPQPQHLSVGCLRWGVEWVLGELWENVAGHWRLRPGHVCLRVSVQLTPKINCNEMLAE